jgi:acyl dehydratase
MFGGILGSQFPGSIYMLQNLMFKAPCFVGSTVIARLEVQFVFEWNLAYVFL